MLSFHRPNGASLSTLLTKCYAPGEIDRTAAADLILRQIAVIHHIIEVEPGRGGRTPNTIFVVLFADESI